MGRPAGWTDEDEAVIAAAELSIALQSGMRPAPINSALPTFPGEAVYSQAPSHLQVFVGASATYSRGGFVALGNPLFTAATIGASLMFNASQRRNAERQAAVQWRPANAGMCFLTSHRLAVQGSMGWFELAWGDLRNAEIDPSGIVMWGAQGAPIRMIVPGLPWHYVLLRYLAWGQLVPVPIPDDLAAKAGRFNRVLPRPAPALPAPQPWSAPNPQHRQD